MFQDWVIAVDSLDPTGEAHTISERLDYAVPVMLALPLEDSCHLPPEEGWMVLDYTGHWVPDPSIHLLGHHRRPSADGLTHPCPEEDSTDYTGRVLTTLETRSMAECVETCLDLGVCRVVTWVRGNICILRADTGHRLEITLNPGQELLVMCHNHTFYHRIVSIPISQDRLCPGRMESNKNPGCVSPRDGCYVDSYLPLKISAQQTIRYNLDNYIKCFKSI